MVVSYLTIAGVYLGACQISMIELFAKSSG